MFKWICLFLFLISYSIIISIQLFIAHSGLKFYAESLNSLAPKQPLSAIIEGKVVYISKNLILLFSDKFYAFENDDEYDMEVGKEYEVTAVEGKIEKIIKIN